MKEIKNIIEAYENLKNTQTKAALATVVRVEGSSYRRTGARMLIADDGTWVGGISGGCLEGDALKRARLAIAKAAPSLVTYDTTQDDQHQIGVGLGCNGVIDVLLSPIDYDNTDNPLEILKNCLLSRRQTHILLTITDVENIDGLSAGQTILYVNPLDLAVFGQDSLQKTIHEAIESCVLKGKSMPKAFVSGDGTTVEIFIEILPPEIHVVLMGHQYDALPMARLIKEIGWRTTVVANPQKVMQKLFSVADELISPDDFTKIEVDTYTAIVLMSHDFKTDKYNLPKALAAGFPYIGMLGPRVRAEKIFNELTNEGIEISENEMPRIFAPTGLDIGAITPEEIALSMIAEMRAFFSARNGEPLRLRTSPIHERG